MNKPLKILVIEDSPADYLLLERHIIQHAAATELRRIDSDAELDAALQTDWDIVLSDYIVLCLKSMGRWLHLVPIGPPWG